MRRAIHQEAPAPAPDQSTEANILVTGIKVVDLLPHPMPKVARSGCSAALGVGKTVIIMERPWTTSPRLMALAWCSPAAGERTREGNDFYHEMIESRVNKDPHKGSNEGSACMLVYGQMNESPGARARVGLFGLDRRRIFPRPGPGRAVLRRQHLPGFTQAGSKSPRCSRIPSAVGYQPTLATDMGALQERITTTAKGSITSVQAIYVPADDLTDPAPATSFAHLDATTVLSRGIFEKAIFPAVDPLDPGRRGCFHP